MAPRPRVDMPPRACYWRAAWGRGGTAGPRETNEATVTQLLRIYRQAKTATQSGAANTRLWVVEFEPEAARAVEPLMGWTSSADTKDQVRLFFDSEAEALAYAKKNGYMYSLERPREAKIRPKAYADNFRYDRLGPWTH